MHIILSTSLATHLPGSYIPCDVWKRAFGLHWFITVQLNIQKMWLFPNSTKRLKPHVHIDDAQTTLRQSQQTARKGNTSQRTPKVAIIKVDGATRRATQTRKIQRRKTHVLVDDVTIQRRNASTNRRKENSLPYHNVNHAATSSKK